MTEPSLSVIDRPGKPAAAPVQAPRGGRIIRWRAAAAAMVAACAALGWQGGAVGLAGTLASAALLLWLLRGGGSGGGGDEVGRLSTDKLGEPRVSGGRVGAEVMVSQVVPVWSTQLDVTRDTAAEGLGKLLASFSAMAGTLGSLGERLDNFGPQLDAGAVDNAVAGQAAALDALLSASQRAFDQRDAAVAELIRCASVMDEVRQLGRLAREIGKHTRLVAFNASIEANRNGNGNQSGAQAVANETRTLSARMAEVGEKIERLVATLARTLSPQRLSSEIADTRPDELRIELDLRARQALTGLQGAMGGAMHSSAEIKAVSRALSHQLEETLVALQFGDRLSQMMNTVSKDMQRFAHWVAANPYASQSDAAEWLDKLEASYTLELQRSRHHGNVHIDRGSEVEFFEAAASHCRCRRPDPTSATHLPRSEP